MISVGIGAALAAPVGTGAAPAPPAENLLRWTEALDNAVWTATGGLTVVADNRVAPDAQTTADTCSSPALNASIGQVSETAATVGSAAIANLTLSTSWVREFVTGAFDGADYVLSVHVQGEGEASARLQLDISGGFLRARLIDTTDGLEFSAWGWQLETGTLPTTYVPRTT